MMPDGKRKKGFSLSVPSFREIAGIKYAVVGIDRYVHIVIIGDGGELAGNTRCSTTMEYSALFSWQEEKTNRLPHTE
jgi:hypothetical protein